MICLLLFLATTLQSTPMKFTTVAAGGDSQIETSRMATVRTPVEWSALWKEHAGDGAPPAVDFNSSMVLAVFTGTRPTAGYSVEITAIEARDDGILVTYRERGPRPDEMVAQMLTAPFHLVRTDARPGKVTFKRVDAQRPPEAGGP